MIFDMKFVDGFFLFDVKFRPIYFLNVSEGASRINI